MATRGLRSLIREIRHTLKAGAKVQDARITQYVLKQYKLHQVSQEQTCKAAQEMSHLSNTYATYLASQRQWQAVHDEYHKGELTTRQAADKVGFKLPHDPK